MQKFFGGAMRGGDVESVLDVAAHDVRDRDGKFTHARGLHEAAAVLDALQSDFEQLQLAGWGRPAAPAPRGIAADRKYRSTGQPREQQPQWKNLFGAADIANVVGSRYVGGVRWVGRVNARG